jgi:predicted ATPase
MRKSAGSALPDSLVAQIYQRTNGIPLLVEEFVRMARESSFFQQERAQEIPATLQQLVMARLDRMASKGEVAQFAATLGREFQ